MLVLAGLLGLVGLVCYVILLIDAFKDEVWKGLVGLVCGLYLLYYAVAECDLDNKVPLIIGWLGGIIGYGVLHGMAAAAAPSMGFHP